MRKHRVDERAAAGAGLAAGVLAVVGDASPTGSTAIDAVLITVSVALVTWASATAPWWAVAAIAGLSAAIAGSVLWLIVGILAFAVGLWVGTERRDLPLARAAVTGIALNVLIRSDLGRMLGLSAMIGIAAATAVLVLGLRRRSRPVRRAVWLGLIATGSFVGLAILGIALGGALAAPDLRDANRTARAGIDLLDDGDYAAAADQFDQAATGFAAADSALTKPWALPAAAVPILAQNRTATTELASTAAATTKALAGALRAIDPDQLRLVNGRIDVTAVESIRKPFAEVQQAIDDLDSTLDDVASPWLAAPLQDRLVDLSDEVDDAQPRVDHAVNAVNLAPQMLGADGPRRYFIAFTTPAETRGQGGFMGNWAELTATDGRIEVSDFGRTIDLNRATTTPREVTGPDDWLELWGPFGFTSGPNGRTEPEPWSNITISPEFPSTAQVIAELYPQSGGGEIDGVFAMDPFVLQALLGLTGPISIAGSDAQLNSSNLARFLLVDQYEIGDEADRVDLLADVSQATVIQVLGGALPSPTVVADALSPLAAQGRLTGWARNADEQDLFHDIHLDGSLPELEGGDGIAAVFNNAGANKLDVYLERELDYDATVDLGTGEVTAVATLTVTNTAPPSGLPDGVMGNYTDDVAGTNRTMVSLYSALPIVSSTVTIGDPSDGSAEPEPFAVDVGTEQGWLVGTGFLAIPPGESVTITYELAGTFESVANGSAYSLSTRPQPIVIDEVQDLRVVTSDGALLIDRSGPATEPGRISIAT